MTRRQRVAQLNELLKSEAGLAELKQIYRDVCQPTEIDPAAPALTDAMLIDAILEAEFPTGLVEENTSTNVGTIC